MRTNTRDKSASSWNLSRVRCHNVEYKVNNIFTVNFCPLKANTWRHSLQEKRAKTTHKHMANYRGVKPHDLTAQFHVKFLLLTQHSALHKHELSHKKGRVTEQRTANVQMSLTVEVA